MDNQTNEIRRDIKLLRTSMQEAENSVQALVAEDQDCSEPSQALLRMRVRMAELCRKKVALGDKSELSGQVKVLPPKPPVVQALAPMKRKLFARA